MDNILNPTKKTFQNLSIGSIDSVTYNAPDDAVITADNNKLNILQVSAEGITSLDIPSFASPQQKEAQENTEIVVAAKSHDRLRFISTNTDSKMAVTHFGNILTSYSKKPQTAITNYGFSQGVHYWEIICPNKCAGIEVGIVGEGWTLPEPGELKNKYVFVDFNTSTARTICLELDLVELKLHAWLKPNESKKKSVSISYGRWYPCVRINEMGNVAVLNTRTSFGDLSAKPIMTKQYAKRQVKKALAHSLLVLNSESSKESGLNGYNRFKTDKELEDFKKSLTTKDFVADSENIAALGYKIAKGEKLEEGDNENQKEVQTRLSKNFSKIVESYNVDESEKKVLNEKIASLSTLLENTNNKGDSHSSAGSSDIQVKYIKSTDSVLITKGELIKMVTRTNGNFNANDLFSFNRPSSPKDKIQLFLDFKLLKLLWKRIESTSDFVANISNHTDLSGLDQLLDAIQTSLKENSFYGDYLVVSVVYKYAKRGFDVLIQFLENSLRWLRSTLNGKEDKNIKGAICKDISENELERLLNFGAGIDETLFAMIHHEDAQDKLFAYWQSVTARVFTSIDRIETLASLPDSQYDIEKLSDMGIINKPYLYYDFTYYLNEGLSIDSDKIIKASSPAEIGTLIRANKNITPKSGFISSKNVPLSVTLNNLPPQIDTNRKLRTLLASEELPYAVSITQQGEVSIWGTKKVLTFLCKSDFTKESLKKKPILFKKKEKAPAFGAPAPAQGFFGGGDPFGAPIPANQAQAQAFQEPEELDEEDGEEIPAGQAAGVAQNVPPSAFGLGNSNPFLGAGGSLFGGGGGGFGSSAGFGPSPFGPPATGFSFGGGSSSFGGGGFGFQKAAAPKTKTTKISQKFGAVKQILEDEKKPKEKDFGSLLVLPKLGEVEEKKEKDDEKEKDQEKKLEGGQEKEAEKPNDKEEGQKEEPSQISLSLDAGSLAIGDLTEKKELKGLLAETDKVPKLSGFSGFGFAPPPSGSAEYPFGGGKTITYDDYVDDWEDIPGEDFGQLKPSPFGLPPLPGKSPQKTGFGSTGQPKDKSTTEETEVFNLEGCTVTGNVIVPIHETPLCPLVVGLCFKKEKDCVLRLRRFAYSPAYIKKFFYKHPTDGLFSLINSKLFDANNFDEIQKHLTQEYGLVFSGLEPLLAGRDRYRNKGKSDKLIQAEWMALDETDVKLPFDDLLSFTLLSKKEVDNNQEVRTIFAIGKKDSQLEACLITVKSTKKNPYDADYSREKSFTATVTINKASGMPALEGQRMVAFSIEDYILVSQIGQDSLYVLDKQLNFIKTAPVGFEVKDVKILDSGTIGFLDPDSKLHVYKYENGDLMPELPEIKRALSSKDYLKQIEESPLNHLDEVLEVLKDSTSGEKLAENTHIHVYEKQSSSSISLNENEQYSRILVNLNFISKADNKYPITEEVKQKLVQTLKTLNEKDVKPEESAAQLDAKSLVSNEFPLFERTSLDPGNLRYLPIIVDKIKGDVFNQFLSGACLTTPSTEVFASKYPDAEFTFKHLHDKFMLIDSITLAAPLQTTGLNGYPLASGFLYLIDDLSALSQLDVPNVKTQEEFKALYLRNKQNKSVTDKIQPVGFFNLGDSKETCNFELEEKKPAKFIVLKPLQLRNEGNFFSAKDFPVEISFFGVHGVALNRDLTIQKKGNVIEDKHGNISVNLKVEGKINENWQELFNSTEVSISKFNHGLNPDVLAKVPELKGLSLGATAKVNISNEIFENNRVKEIRVTISASDKEEAWTLFGLDVQPVILNKAKDLKLNYTSAQILRDTLTLKDRSQELLKLFISHLISETDPIEQRIKIAQIIHIILNLNPSLASFVFNQINLETYVTHNVLVETKYTGFHFLSLLKDLSLVEGFKTKLSQTLINLLPQLSQTSGITSNGVKTYFTLLYWVSPDSSALSSTIGELKRLTKQAELSRIPGYKMLRSQYNIPLLSFERSLFDEKFILQFNDNPIEQISSVEMPIKCKFLHKCFAEGDEYLIDLQQIHNLSQIKLWFPEQDKICSLRVQIWGVTGENDRVQHQLLISQYFGDTEGVWSHLTKQAYEPSLIKYFNDSEQLSTLGFELNAKLRYVLVQVTYSFRAGLPSLNKDINKKSVVPIVYGQPIENQTGDIESLVKRFDVKNAAIFKNNVEVTSWLSYDKFDNIPEGTSTFLYEYVSDKDKKEGGLSDDSEYDLLAKLSSLQTELYNQLYQQRTPNHFFKNNDSTLELCQKIQNIQIRLYNRSNGKQSYSTKSQNTSLGLVINLVEAISQYILKVILNNPQAEQTYFAPQDIKDMFDCLFLFETPSYLEQLNKLVHTWIWPSFDQNKQNQVLNSIFDAYLTSSISLLHEPVEKLYPTPSVVEFLVTLVKKNFSQVKVFLGRLGEVSSLIGNTYALITINEVCLRFMDFNLEGTSGILEALVRNLHYTIETPEFMDTEKQYLVGLIVDIIMIVIDFVSANEIDKLYKEPRELFRVFHYVSKNKLRIIEQKLIRILNTTCETRFEKYNVMTLETDMTRLRLVLMHADDPYAHFFLYALRDLISLAKGEKKPLTSGLGYFSEKITSTEWKELSRLFILHLYTILENDRKDRLIQQKAQLRKEKKASLEEEGSEKGEEEKVSGDKAVEEEKDSEQISKDKGDKEEDVDQDKEDGPGKDDKTEEKGKNEVIEEEGEDDDEEKDKASTEKTKRKENKVQIESIPGVTLKKFTLDDSDEADEGCLMLSQLVLDLVSLLSSQVQERRDFTFSESKEHWLFIVKTVSMFKITDRIGSKIAFQLVEAFFKASVEIKDYVYSFLTVIFKSFQSLSFDIVAQLTAYSIDLECSELEGSSSKADIPSNVLLTSGFDRIKQLIEPQQGKANLSYNELLLIKILSTFKAVLKNTLNFGSRSLVSSCSQAEIAQLQRIYSFISLIETSKTEKNDHPLSFTKFLENYKPNKDFIDSFVETLAMWYTINKFETESPNPACQAVSNISKKVQEILKAVSQNEEATKAALKCLLGNFSEILNIISDLTCKRVIKGTTSIAYTKSACQTFQEILGMWITTENLADYFNREINGFEYLLRVLGFVEHGTKAKPSLFFQHTEISEYFSRRFAKLHSAEYSLTQLYDDASRPIDSDLPEEEFCKKVRIHRMKGQKWPRYLLDLTVNKVNPQRVLSFFIDADEYNLCLEFESFFELKNISIGLIDQADLGFSQEHLSVVPEIFAEAGPSTNDLYYIGKLNKETDLSNSNHIHLFSKNFEGFTDPSGSGSEEWLRSTTNIRVKFLKLRFKKPIIRFFENFGLNQTKPYKSLTVNLAFVSASGTNVNNYGNVPDQVKEFTQVTAMKIIEKMGQDFPEAWRHLAEKEFFLEKDQSCLKTISKLVDLNNEIAVKILLHLSKFCHSIGNWLFEQLLESPNAKKYSGLISELIVNEPSCILLRVEKLSQFLIKEATRLSITKAPEQHTYDFEAFIQFVEILSSTINVVPEQTLAKGINVNIKMENVQDLVNLYRKFSDLSNSTINIAKLAIIYIFYPKYFISADSNILKSFLDLVYEIYHKEGKIDLLKLLALIGVGSAQAAKWLLEHTNQIFEDICSSITKTPSGQFKSLKPMFAFLQSIMTSEGIKKKFIKENWHLRLLNLFKVDEKTSNNMIFKTNDPEILEYLQTFLRDITLDFPEKEEELAQILKEDLSRLTEINDNAFLEHFFLPLLKAEHEVPICLFPYDYSKKQWVGDLHSQAAASTQSFGFQSKLLKGNQTKAFNTMFEKLTKKAGTYNKFSAMKWKRVLSTTQDGDAQILKTLNEKVVDKGSFLIIFEGNVNAGGFGMMQQGNMPKKATVGVFCGKSFPQVTNQNNFYGTIEKSNDSFIFYYDEKRRYHFPLVDSTNKNCAAVNIYPSGGGLSFFYHTISPVCLSLVPTQPSYCSIDLLAIRPVDFTDDVNKMNFLNVQTVSQIEIWTLDKADAKNEGKIKSSNIVKMSNILRSDLFDDVSPLNFYRPMPIYRLPATISIEQLAVTFFKQKIPLILKATHEELAENEVLAQVHEFVKKDQQSQGIIDIEFDYNKFLEIKQSGALAAEHQKSNYTPNMTVFNAFKQLGGVETMLTVAKSNIEKWKKQELKTKWTKWMGDLQSLSDFPNFFEAFIKNPESIELLFQILANKPDEEAQRSEEDAKKWDEKELVSHKYIYQALADSFKMVPSIDACKLAIETNKFGKILDVLGVISKEKPRRWVENPDEEEKKQSESQQTSPTKKEDGGDKKKPSKKKGVGYGSDYVGGVFQPQNQKADVWNVNQFVEKKMMKNEQLIALINVIASIFETQGWEPPANVLKMICESALLPLLESAFRNGSLVDMGKESDLYIAYLRLVKALSIHKSLIPCLLELERNYMPKQRDSVYSLLSHMNDIAKIFISCLSNTDYKKEDEEKEKEESGIAPLTAGGGIFGDPLGGQANNDVGNAWKILNQPVTKYTKMFLSSMPKEYLFQTALTANNPDLAPQGPGLSTFGGGSLFGGFNAQQNANKLTEPKPAEKKPKPSVFTSKVTKAAPAKSAQPASTEEVIEEVPEKKGKQQPQEKEEEIVTSKHKTKKSRKSGKAKKSRRSKKSKDTDNEKDEEAQQNERLAHEIIEAFELVRKEVAIFRATDVSRTSMEETLKKPLPEAYRSLLGGLRFDYMDMKEPSGGKPKHYYGYMATPSIPPQAKMIRLAQELADLSNSLPHEHTNAIFVRVDKTKVDLMKVLIMGPSGTPYGHGAFEYDVFFDDSYPNTPPKVNLMTTGGGAVRFNPNLYANGKVCLSLLGTWSGRGGENWNPKLSTFLQVLLSIQSLIMTEDIYYNEPGLEVYAGTPQGELENEGYSNVVRYANIKYAMLDQLRHPSKGFETVTKRHFYLKKKEIMDEVKQWIELSKTKDAQYNGCQNYNWQNTFNQSKTKYHDMLVEIAAELEDELNKIPPPTETEIDDVVEVKRGRKAKVETAREQEKPTEDIDVTYDKEVKTKELDITDDTVKDRWSRYIGAMGIEAVAKQANSSVFLSGLGALGVEIAKNITLSGVKRLTLHDSKKVELGDLAGQFFVEEEDVGKNRVSASLSKLQQLNFYVKIDTLKLDEELPTDEQELQALGLQGYNIIIATETSRATLIALDKFCRGKNIAFIAADVYGPYSKIFCDFGDEFVVTDKDGEEPREVLIKSITNEEKGLVTLLETNKHNFEDGDEILITEVVGMEDSNDKQGSSINDTRHKVQVENAFNFRIGDTRNYGAYQFNGKVKLIKNPVTVKFRSLEDSLANADSNLDQNLVNADFVKISNPILSHIMFQVLEDFRDKNKRLPKAWDETDSNEFIQLVEKYKDQFNSKIEFNEDLTKFAKTFASTCSGVFSPLAAFIGGFVSQEIVKALTNKFMPINQFFYSDCTELISSQQVVQKGDKYDGLRVVIGNELFDKLSQLKVFMVGVGAIGCELLKNFAMLSIGASGALTITDPDVIETSNLNRQFLFREKHLRKPKSQTAAASIVQMNKDLKGKINARLDKVHPGTAHIFTDKFFEEVDLVANALDNVQARRYIDLRCVKAKTPLLESGTLGPKGHVQVIVPFKTESYSSQEDPQDENEIPHCTLKMFPEETLHCVEWARDKFGKLFTQKPKSLAKLIEDPDFSPSSMQELATLKQAVKLLKKMPTNFDDCVRYARHKFQKYFVNDIRQLLFTYPLDHKTKQGTPFWASPKRPPLEITFDPNNILHAAFIVACASLWASVFGIPCPNDCWKDQGKLRIAQEAQEVKVKDFKPSNDKAKALASEVEAEEKEKKQEQPEKVEEEQEEEKTFVIANEFEVYKKEFQQLVANLPADKSNKVVIPQEFEKDNDKNFHIEFIYALANCRASNYKLATMDWMTVKLKAGRIVPALATTTASIAGLQTIELCKIVNQNKIEEVKNAFLNFAVPYLTLSEPGPVKCVKITDKLTASIWDRWEVSLDKKASLQDLFKRIHEQYEIECRDVLFEGKMIYLHNIMEQPGREGEKEKVLNQELRELVELEDDATYVDLAITFSKPGEQTLLENTPEVRVFLK